MWFVQSKKAVQEAVIVRGDGSNLAVTTYWEMQYSPDNGCWKHILLRILPNWQQVLGDSSRMNEEEQEQADYVEEEDNAGT